MQAVVAQRRADLFRAGILALLMVLAAVVAVAITPRHYMADAHRQDRFATLIPQAFGDWRIDRSIIPLQPSPDLQQVIDETYDETLGWTYRDSRGRRVMLAVAYGLNQHKGMNTHRPEICYPSQGFKLRSESQRGVLQFENRQIPITRLVAGAGARNEPITYWLLVGDEVTFFGRAQRWAAIRYGLGGVVPDGVLVRVSSIDANEPAAFALQEAFLKDMLAAIAPDKRARLIGTH
ncbi:exosortase-associated protein EpsI, B-type [Aquabacterium sp.]|uniref:exosortase-associated protein EpsI, B-type n=1 Tax=Aquabacterium sp. TaxID=1872578 RepID=UPI00378334E2